MLVAHVPLWRARSRAVLAIGGGVGVLTSFSTIFAESSSPAPAAGNIVRAVPSKTLTAWWCPRHEARCSALTPSAVGWWEGSGVMGAAFVQRH